MSDLIQKLDEVRPLVSRPFSDELIDHTVRRAQHRLRRRRRYRAMAAALLAVLVVGAGWYRFSTRPTLTFADGSTADLLDSKSELSITESSPERFEVRLDHGGSRFEVARNPHRKFRVVAGDVAVEVIGTRFVVSREADEVQVRVERGRVRVMAASGERFLNAGEEARFAARAPTPPPAVAPPKSPPSIAPPAMTPPAVAPPTTPAPETSPAHQGWRASATHGNFERAYQEIQAGGPRAVRDLPEELMMAADVARWSHHPAAAVPLLEKVVRVHARDPRAQLAAFTLGRVLLDELGNPRRAAAAFAQARVLGSDGPLAEDALAHEAQAWSLAGELARARESADAYLWKYPSGAHAQAVRHFGGIE